MRFRTVKIASYTSIEPALQPAKLCEGIREGVREVGSSFAVQSFGLD
jgi:hypothetical protein